jgi:hypothetical protein
MRIDADARIEAATTAPSIGSTSLRLPERADMSRTAQRNATMTIDTLPNYDPKESSRLENIVRSSAILSPVLERWSTISLPDCWLSGTVIAQTVWNETLGLPCHHGLADIDLVYFDTGDLSAEAEMRQAARVRNLLADLRIWIDAKNQARVHLWYESKFGYPIAPYASTAHAIATFPTTVGAVGIRPTPSGLSIFAPFGLSDLLGLVVRPNKTQITRAIYETKTARWRTLWPQLRIADWSEADAS